MKHYQDFCITGDSFADRIGEPDEFDAAVGRIVLGFSYLEDTARNVISLLVSPDLRLGAIISAELSFRQKVDVLASLVWHRLATTSQPDRELIEEHFREILILCRRSEELRNQHLHSRYSRFLRAKTTAKANRGLHTAIEPTSPAILLDVADFIVSTAVILEEFPGLLGIADLIGGSFERVEYSLRGEVVAVFDFGDQQSNQATHPTTAHEEP